MKKYKLSLKSYAGYGLAAAVFLHAGLLNNNTMTLNHWSLLFVAGCLLVPDLVEYYKKK